MDPSDIGRAGDCESVRDLVVWYPSGTLSADERRRVEEHVARCTECLRLLHFATTLKDDLTAPPGPHPEPDTLIRCVAARTSGGDEMTRDVEKHLAACQECREIVSILGDLAPGAATAPATERTVAQVVTPARDRRAGALAWVRDLLRIRIWWPIPAAIVVIVLALMRVPRLAGPAQPGVGLGVWGVISLVNESEGTRGEPAGELAAQTISASRPPMILLEFTSLESPPQAGSRYRVTLTEIDTGRLVWEDEIDGASFADNYTLVLSPERIGLGRGAYQVSVADPQGKVFFRSSLEVK
jgi:predicted anti-sigma-YlaC factor YlaD